MDSWNQAINDLLSHLGWTGEAAVRLCIAALLGGIVGVEREVRGRQAGFRTNLLVCLGSALVMLVSVYLSRVRWQPLDAYNINVDPGRIAYGVMTGIGFLGAGAIIKHDNSVRGLTTAAGLWCVAAIGLAVGLGLYVLSFLATALVLLGLWALYYWELILPKRQFRRMVVRCPWSADCVEAVLSRFRSAAMDISEHGFARTSDLNHVDVNVTASFNSQSEYDAFERTLHRETQWTVISSTRN